MTQYPKMFWYSESWDFSLERSRINNYYSFSMCFNNKQGISKIKQRSTCSCSWKRGQIVTSHLVDEF